MARLERERLRQDVSIYGYYPNFVASIDFVKSDRGGHRDAFLRDAPDLIIVDEAHIAARPGGAGERVEHQRHEVLRDLAKDPSRHIILVTATPHSGIEESFRSLLGLLDPDLERQTDRKRLLPHVIQRRRQDVEKWLGSETPFPKRESEERRYELAGDYLKLFNDVLEYCRETVEAGRQLRATQQRVRHWAAIALLRCLLSSPAAAATFSMRVLTAWWIQRLKVKPKTMSTAPIVRKCWMPSTTKRPVTTHQLVLWKTRKRNGASQSDDA
jgi:hypothetical protein